MHVISLYLVFHACAATFYMICVKKKQGNQTEPKYLPACVTAVLPANTPRRASVATHDPTAEVLSVSGTSRYRYGLAAAAAVLQTKEPFT
jgi:hypothetical protein